MNVLRSIHLPIYQRQIQHPYTSDPFPRNSITSDGDSSSVISTQEESKVSYKNPISSVYLNVRRF